MTLFLNATLLWRVAGQLACRGPIGLTCLLSSIGVHSQCGMPDCHIPIDVAIYNLLSKLYSWEIKGGHLVGLWLTGPSTGLTCQSHFLLITLWYLTVNPYHELHLLLLLYLISYYAVLMFTCQEFCCAWYGYFLHSHPYISSISDTLVGSMFISTTILICRDVHVVINITVYVLFQPEPWSALSTLLFWFLEETIISKDALWVTAE